MIRHFPRLFWQHVIRDVGRHRLLALLNVLSIALGVAVYLAIQIANENANRAFAASVDLVAGKAHLEIRGDVPETLWPEVEKQAGVEAVTGMVEGLVTLPEHPGEYLRILGVDPFSSTPFLTFPLSPADSRLDLERWLNSGDGIVLEQLMAKRLGVQAGDRLRVLVNAKLRELRVLWVIDLSDSPGRAEQRVAAMDLGWAQELLGKQGRLTSLQLRLKDPRRSEEVAAKVNAMLPADLHVEAPRQRSLQLQNMVSAFRLNLTALSMVSLLVGVFLVYNTISATVARRRREIGILRAVGASRNEVRALFLGEACIFGIVGVALGLASGVALSSVLSGAVAQTISALYVLVSVRSGELPLLQLVTAASFGMAAVLAGAWLPANEAAQVDPVRALSIGGHMEETGRARVHWTGLGVAAMALAAVLCWLALATGPATLAFGAAFCVLTGWAMLAPASIAGVSRAVLAGTTRSATFLWRLAADHLARSVHRNAITVAALAIAFAMMTGLTVMIHSFRNSVSAWIDGGIVADLFIAPASNEVIGLGATVPEEALRWLHQQEEVASVDTFREQSITFVDPEGRNEKALLAVVGGSYRGNLPFSEGDGARVFQEPVVAVTESFARKWKVHAGESLTLTTPAGSHSFPIVGVYADYSRDQGTVLMARPTFDRFWQQPGVNSLAVYLHKGRAPDPLAERFREEFGRQGEFAIYSNRALRERIFTIFDQTFAVTAMLRVIAVIVALLGIFLAVTALVTERERETGMLRAVGASQGQIVRLFMAESVLMGAIAALLGTVAGVVLALVLTKVVNPAFFGWTIHLYWPWWNLFAAPFWIVATAAAAAWYPAARGARVTIAASIREE